MSTVPTAILQVLVSLVVTGVLIGCAPAPALIVLDVVSAAVNAGAAYSEANTPTSAEAWQNDRLESLQQHASVGDFAAQYQLGIYYQSIQHASAQTWICRAANAGYAQAQLALGHWYNEDRNNEDLWPFIDIRPDNREAFVWYNLARINGVDTASLYLANIVSVMRTSGQLAEAQARLSSWSPRGCGFFSLAPSSVADYSSEEFMEGVANHLAGESRLFDSTAPV